MIKPLIEISDFRNGPIEKDQIRTLQSAPAGDAAETGQKM